MCLVLTEGSCLPKGVISITSGKRTDGSIDMHLWLHIKTPTHKYLHISKSPTPSSCPPPLCPSYSPSLSPLFLPLSHVPSPRHGWSTSLSALNFPVPLAVLISIKNLNYNIEQPCLQFPYCAPLYTTTWLPEIELRSSVLGACIFTY